MASKKLRILMASGLLAFAAALAGTTGAAFAGSPGPTATPGPLTVCDNVNPNIDPCCPSVVNGAVPADLQVCCVSLGVAPAVEVCPSPSPTATPTETATATATETPTECVGVDVNPDAFTTATPTVCPTAFESFQGETATAGQNTPPPTSTGANDPRNNSLPLFALLICLAFGAIGLAAAADQRRTIRR